MSHPSITFSFALCVCNCVSYACAVTCVCACVRVFVSGCLALRLSLCVFLSVCISLTVSLCLSMSACLTVFVCICVGSHVVDLGLKLWVITPIMNHHALFRLSSPTGTEFIMKLSFSLSDTLCPQITFVSNIAPYTESDNE